MMEEKIYVTIPDTYAFHCHHDMSKQIGYGDLTLVRITKQTIGVTVGKAAFPLSKTTPFGTLDNDPYSYVFNLADVPGHVRLLLPSTVSPSLQDTFEQILIRFGLLKDDLAAYTDELARSAEESSLQAAQRLSSYTDTYISSKPATSYPVSIDPNLHKIVDTASQHIKTATHRTGDATRFVGQHVHNGTGWVTQQASGRPPIVRSSTTKSSLSSPVDPEEQSLTLRTLATEYMTTTTSLSSSIGALAAAAGSSATQIVGHEFGPDAQRLTSGALASLAGVGQVLADVGKVTSAGWFVGRGVLAALDVTDPEVAREVRSEGMGLEAKASVEMEKTSIVGGVAA